MKKTALLILAVLLWALPATAKETVRSFRQQIPLGTAGRIHLDFPVGEIRVEGWDNRQVGLDVKIICNELTRRCEEGARALRVVFNRDHGQLEIHVVDWPHLGAAKGLNVDAVMHVPRNLPL